jgi:hypothetical protein
MSNRLRISSSTLRFVLVAVLLAPAFVVAQTPSAAPAKQATTTAAKSTKAKAETWALEHTPDGQPDLQGVWSNATLTPLERPRELGDKQYFTEAEAAAFEKQMLQRNDADRRDTNPEADVAQAYNNFWYDRGNRVVPTLRTSLIIDPPDGRIPALTPEAQKREASRAEASRGRGPADSYLDRSLAERCLTRGSPKLPSAYNNNFQIVQSPGFIAIVQEMIHETRMIRLDDSPHVGSKIREWLGDSRGHWESNTLVVDTTNYNDHVSDCCRASGAHLHIVERFTRIDAHTIDYQFTVDDPSTFTKPWTVAVPLTRDPGPVYEYACHEDNYAMANMLNGARTEEKAAAEAAKKEPR